MSLLDLVCLASVLAFFVLLDRIVARIGDPDSQGKR